MIDVPLERMWAALPQAFADLDYKAGPSAKPGERLYLTPHMTIQTVLYPGHAELGVPRLRPDGDEHRFVIEP